MNKPEKKTRKNYTISERLQSAISARVKKEQTYLNAKMELENHDKVIEKLNQLHEN